MNIFATNKSPIISAQALDDKRVIKMVLESAQMLCTALNERGGLVAYPYSDLRSKRQNKAYYYKGTNFKAYAPTHSNHPCNIWVRKSKANYSWLLEHLMALCAEYTKRYNKRHKTEEHLAHLWEGINLMPGSSSLLHPFPNCAANKEYKINYKQTTPTTEAYKLYLNARWKRDKRTPKWTNSEVPKWANIK